MSLEVAVGNKPGVDKAKGDGVGTNTERTPFLGEGFGKTNNCRLSSSIVSLANVSMKTRDRRDVDDGTVLRITLTQHEYQTNKWRGRDVHLDAHIGGSSADKSEWGTNVNLLDDIPRVVRKSVKHFVICKASYT